MSSRIKIVVFFSNKVYKNANWKEASLINIKKEEPTLKCYKSKIHTMMLKYKMIAGVLAFTTFFKKQALRNCFPLQTKLFVFQ